MQNKNVTACAGCFVRMDIRENLSVMYVNLWLNNIKIYRRNIKYI